MPSRPMPSIAFSARSVLHSWIPRFGGWGLISNKAGYKGAAACLTSFHMGFERPRLVLVKGTFSGRDKKVQALSDHFEVIVADDLTSATRLANGDPEAVLVCSSQQLDALEAGLADASTNSSIEREVIEHVAEGVGVVNVAGQVIWSSQRLRRQSDDVRGKFIEQCTAAIELFNRSEETNLPIDQRHSKEIAFSIDESHYELIVSVLSIDPNTEHNVDCVVGVLWEDTASRQLQKRINAIDSAGADLLRLEADSISKLNMAQRLKFLEDKIVKSVQDLLHFDNFEVRLTDPKSNRLELVIAVGISPLKIGELMYATAEGDGISGYVASTGVSYVCPDVARDPMYREGLDNAASSLTVPLRLHDRVIGVFNIESNTKAAFNENDLLYAELFGRYIAMAMNILDLLVVERYTTNAQVSENLICELRDPLATIIRQAEELKALSGNSTQLIEHAQRILDTATMLGDRIKDCTSGPRTILETEQELHRQQTDPRMVGRRVLIADDEITIRDRLRQILLQRGCDVIAATDGIDAINQIESAAAQGRPFDVVLTDIKMPDRNGYELFRAAKAVSNNTQVILMTGFGYDPHHSIVRSVQEGLHSFLFKPFKASQLIEELTKALERSAAK